MGALTAGSCAHQSNSRRPSRHMSVPCANFGSRLWTHQTLPNSPACIVCAMPLSVGHGNLTAGAVELSNSDIATMTRQISSALAGE
eukprot:1757641-Amphidinium_carterae.1